MFFNEEQTKTDEIETYDDASVSSTDIASEEGDPNPEDVVEEEVDLDFDALGSQTSQEDTIHEGCKSSSDNMSEGCKSSSDNTCEEVDLDFDALDTQTSQEDTIHEGCKSSDDSMSEEIDLDFDALGDQTSQEDTIHEGCKSSSDDSMSEGCKSSSDNTCEEVDLDFDALDTQTSQEDTIHESVENISFSESSVRIFQREDYNLITESDVFAVMNYYDASLSESEIITLVANEHNISEDSIVVLSEGIFKKSDKKVKKAKPKKSGLDLQIESLQKKKSRMSPEMWKKSGLAKQLQKLRARKALSNQ